ncbi:MAG: KEOPS complex kinase/ATPase Bud32 [Candidatus Heimdallarchaeaceae archaeon]
MSSNDTRGYKIDNWGAEAILTRNIWFDYEVIKKIRIPKKYRISQIDKKLREKRTITETKLMIAAKKIGVQTPFVFEIDLENNTIIMEYINGVKVKELLKSTELKKEQKLKVIEDIGFLVGKIHNNDIIHGDLTTSNILFSENKIIFIDFGLGKFSNTVEDKAVDLLLMKKCLRSTHTEMSDELFLWFQKGYQKSTKDSQSIFKRAAKVEARGRHLKEEDVIKDYLI